jgi:hypothetical protein
MRPLYSVYLLPILLSTMLLAQSNPVPLLNQPLVPTSVAPGSPGLTLTVNGTGFVSTSVVNWNGDPLCTTFVNFHQLVVDVPSSDLASASTASVTVSNPAPGGGTSNAVPFTITSRTSSLTFVNSTLPVGTDPQGIVVADFNGDGKSDLAVFNYCGSLPSCEGDVNGSFSILLGNGDGTFTLKSTLSPTGYPISGLAGDFNNDGKLDLAVISESDCMGCASITIYLGNGDGTFTEHENFSTDGVFHAIVAADFNRDGNLDLAVSYDADGFSDVAVLLGNGDGTFQADGLDNFLSENELFVSSLVVGDFNNDGIIDLALVGAGGQTTGGVELGPLSIFLGNGDGTFTAATSQPSVTVVDPVSMTAGDFNGDGNLDLAIADAGSTAVTILTGNGNGTFTQVSGEPSLPQFSNFVTTTDLNGDGKLDLVFSRSCGTGCTAKTISIFLGKGDGTFRPGFSETVGNAPQSVAIGDFNGDGRLDLAVANSADNTITIMLQTGASTTVVSASANPAAYQQPITLSARVTPVNGGSATGTVTFFDGTNKLGTASLNDNNANLTGVILATGSHMITAIYTGGNDVRGSRSVVLTEVVNPAMTSTSLISSANPIAPNQSVIYTATVTSQYGGATTGTVSFKDGKVAVTVPLSGGTATLSETYLSAGAQSVTATYSGDTNNASSTSSALMEYVRTLPVKTTTIVTTSGSPSLVNQPVTFTASVSSRYGAIPDGEMVRFHDGASQIGTGTTASGVAIFTTSELAVKTRTIVGTYAGDATFNTSSGRVQQIVRAYATVTALSASPNPSNYGEAVVLTSVVTTSGSGVPTGKVTFNNGTATLGKGTVDATGTATLSTTKLPVGLDSLTASYNGDSLNSKSTSSVSARTVNPAQLAMTLTSSPNPSTAGKSVKFTATLTSNGSLPNRQQVTFSCNGTIWGTATIREGKATFSTMALPAGSDVVTASYAGNVDYSSASTSVTQTVN